MSFVKEQVIQSLATIDGAQPADPVPSLEVAVTLKCPNSLVTLVSFSGKRPPSWSYPDYPPSTMSHLPKVERKKKKGKRQFQEFSGLCQKPREGKGTRICLFVFLPQFSELLEVKGALDYFRFLCICYFQIQSFSLRIEVSLCIWNTPPHPCLLVHSPSIYP